MRKHGASSFGLQEAIAEYLLGAACTLAFDTVVKERWAKIASRAALLT